MEALKQGGASLEVCGIVVLSQHEIVLVGYVLHGLSGARNSGTPILLSPIVSMVNAAT